MFRATYFYPESGGQPYDLGTIDGIPVTRVVERGEHRVLHFVETFPEGDRVRCRIEKVFGTWKRSYGLRRMRWLGLAKARLRVRLARHGVQPEALGAAPVASGGVIRGGARPWGRQSSPLRAGGSAGHGLKLSSVKARKYRTRLPSPPAHRAS